MNPNENDETLGRTLQEWRVNAPLPPRFQAQVWQRIADATQEKINPWALFRQWFETVFSRPAIGLAYALVLLFLGSGAGFWQAHQKTASIEQSLSSRYVQSLDPYQKTGM